MSRNDDDSSLIEYSLEMCNKKKGKNNQQIQVQILLAITASFFKQQNKIKMSIIIFVVKQQTLLHIMQQKQYVN